MKKYEPITDAIENKFALLGKAIAIHGKVDESATSDLILANLSEQQKEGVIELTRDARYVVGLIMSLLNEKVYDWDNKNHKWIERELNKTETEKIINFAARTSDSITVIPKLVNLTERNNKENPLLKWVFEIPVQEEQEAENQKAIGQGLKRLLKKKDKEDD